MKIIDNQKSVKIEDLEIGEVYRIRTKNNEAIIAMVCYNDLDMFEDTSENMTVITDLRQGTVSYIHHNDIIEIAITNAELIIK